MFETSKIFVGSSACYEPQLGLALVACYSLCPEICQPSAVFITSEAGKFFPNSEVCLNDNQK